MSQAQTPAAAPFVSRSIHIEHLRKGGDNVRTVRELDNSPDMLLLVAAIESLGLIAPLVVVASGGNLFDVVAGGRRLMALWILFKAGRLANPMIDCREATTGDPVTISLIENVARKAMHAADEVVAFKKMLDGGQSVERIATVFAVTVRQVRQRLALAALHPTFLKMLKADEITLNVAQALTCEPDPARQLAVWKRLQAYQRGNPRILKDALSDQEFEASHRLVRFVGLQAYLDAGGELREDLFADEGGQILEDTALLEGLAANKLAAKADALRAEGWGSVEVCLEVPSEVHYRLQRIDARCGGDAKAGALMFVYPDWNGEVATAGPFITKEQARAQARAKARAQGSDGGQDDEEHARVPESLMRSLTAHKSAALQCALLENQRVTPAVLAARLLGAADWENLSMHVRADHQGFQISNEARGYEQTRAARELAAADAAWAERAGEDALAYFLAQPAEVSLAAITFGAARSFSFINRSQGTPEDVAKIQSALAFNFAAYFEPTANTYLNQVPKAKLVEAVTEAAGKEAAAALEKMKKGEAVAAAAAQLAGKQWVPVLVR
jgi:ParB family chromosome partitioning protein